MSEERLTELETRIAFQDDHILALTRSLTDQQQRLDVLAEAVRGLRRQLQAQAEEASAGSAGDEPPPPHY